MGLKQHDGISVPETPIIHKQDLQHKELLVCYPQEKAKPAESSIGKKIKRALFMTQKKHLQCKCFFMVRVVIQHFSKNTVVSMVLGHPNSEITCIPPS